jgi:hypothetical protein
MLFNIGSRMTIRRKENESPYFQRKAKSFMLANNHPKKSPFITAKTHVFLYVHQNRLTSICSWIARSAQG